MRSEAKAPGRRGFLVAALLGLTLAGCNDSTLDLAASGPKASARGTLVALMSLEGAPADRLPRLSAALEREASARELRLMPAGSSAQYQIRVFVDAFANAPGETTVSWTITVSDNMKRIAQRLQGAETIKRATQGGDAWAVADEALLRRTAAMGMDAVAAWVSGSWGPGAEAAGGKEAEPAGPPEAGSTPLTSFAPL